MLNNTGTIITRSGNDFYIFYSDCEAVKQYGFLGWYPERVVGMLILANPDMPDLDKKLNEFIDSKISEKLEQLLLEHTKLAS